jgi:hypothetical protein
MMHDNILIGKSQSIRSYLQNMRKSYVNLKRAATTTMKRSGGTVQHFADSDTVMMRIRVPDGAGQFHDAIIHFPSIKQAEEALRLGTTGTADTMLDKIFDGLDPSVRAQYDEFVKATRKVDPSKYVSEFRPYMYAVEMARQNGMEVGVVGGRYVVHDALGGAYRIFDDLNSVYKFLTDQDGRLVLPDMVPNLTRGALEVGDALQDPLKLKLEKPDMPNGLLKTKQMGIYTHAQMNLVPTQHMIQKLESTAAGQWLASKGHSATHIYNAAQDANRATNAFIANKGRTIKRITKGLNNKTAEAVYDYVEALDNPAERATMGDFGASLRTKPEVYEDLVTQFGKTKADELVDTAVQVRQYFDEMFARAGLNWSQFIQHYMPHIRRSATAKLGNVSTTHFFDYMKGLNIPEHQRLAFFELARESNPNSLIFTKDVRKLMDMYTHMAGRNAFLRPMMANLKKELNTIIRETTSETGAISGDKEMLALYLKNFFESVDGIHHEFDRMTGIATSNSLYRIAEAADKMQGGSKFRQKVNANRQNWMDRIVTLSAGAHLGGRLYSAGRNMTQSLVTTAPLLGLDWWFDGLESSLRPGSLLRMEELGIIKRNALPVFGWREMGTQTFIDKAVSIGMAPFKGADWMNRVISYNTGYNRAKNAFNLMQSGKIRRQAAFARASGARLYGIENYRELMDILNTAKNAAEGGEAFADRLGRLAVDRSQYLYTKFDQPQLFRQGIGRWAGQYTSWPLNFMQLVSGAISPRSGMPFLDRAKFLGTMTAVTGGLAYGAYEAGLNPANFLPWNMADFGMGPGMQMATDLIDGIGGNQESLFNLIRNFTALVPFAYEGSALWRAYQALEDGDYEEMLLHITSAPLNYDVYPRREPLAQPVLDKLYKEAAAYSQARMNSSDTFGRIVEGAERIFN